MTRIIWREGKATAAGADSDWLGLQGVTCYGRHGLIIPIAQPAAIQVGAGFENPQPYGGGPARPAAHLPLLAYPTKLSHGSLIHQYSSTASFPSPLRFLEWSARNCLSNPYHRSHCRNGIHYSKLASLLLLHKPDSAPELALEALSSTATGRRRRGSRFGTLSPSLFCKTCCRSHYVPIPTSAETSPAVNHQKQPNEVSRHTGSSD